MKKLNVSVIGLGFIGLPLSLSYAMRGADVLGIDVSESLVNEINQGITHHLEFYQGKPIQEILREQIAAGRFRATTKYTDAVEAGIDTYIITVGVPVRNGDPDFSALRSAASSLAKILKKGDLVIVRSTVVPGTTEEMIIPLLEESGLKAGSDFDLAYCSERIAEGKAFEEFVNMPIALGGINERSAQRAKDVLTFVTEADVHITSIKIVETAKVIENIQRDVNIAMVQEFARFAEKMGLDTFELIRIANTHKRVNLLTPGPGVGGYCLPNAFYYLQPKAEELGVKLRLLELARRINDSVPETLVSMMEEAFAKRGKTLSESRIAVLGLAMKDYSNDDRISPCHEIVRILGEKGAVVKAYDPAVPGRYPYKVDSLAEAVDGADGLFLLAMQKEFETLDWTGLVERMKPGAILFDTKNRIPKDLGRDITVLRI